MLCVILKNGDIKMKKLILMIGIFLFSNNVFLNGKLCEKLYDVLQACPENGGRGSYINAACPQFTDKVREWQQVNKDIINSPEKSKQIQRRIEDIQVEISKRRRILERALIV